MGYRFCLICSAVLVVIAVMVSAHVAGSHNDGTPTGKTYYRYEWVPGGKKTEGKAEHVNVYSRTGTKCHYDPLNMRQVCRTKQRSSALNSVCSYSGWYEKAPGSKLPSGGDCGAKSNRTESGWTYEYQRHFDRWKNSTRTVCSISGRWNNWSTPSWGSGWRTSKPGNGNRCGDWKQAGRHTHPATTSTPPSTTESERKLPSQVPTTSVTPTSRVTITTTTTPRPVTTTTAVNSGTVCSGIFDPSAVRRLVGWRTAYKESYPSGAATPPWVNLLTPPGEDSSYRLVAGVRNRYPGTPNPLVQTVWDPKAKAADWVIVDLDDPDTHVTEGGCGWEAKAVISEMVEVLMWDGPSSEFSRFVPTRTSTRGVPRSSTSTDVSDPPYLVAWWENLTDLQKNAVKSQVGAGRWKVKDECSIVYGSDSQCGWWNGPPWPGVYWWRVGLRVVEEQSQKKLLLVLYENAWYVPGIIDSGWSVHRSSISGGG